LANDVVSEKDNPTLDVAGRLRSAGTEVGSSLDRRVLIHAIGTQKKGLVLGTTSIASKNSDELREADFFVRMAVEQRWVRLV